MAEFLEEIKVNLRFGLLYGAENKNPSAELYIFEKMANPGRVVHRSVK